MHNDAVSAPLATEGTPTHALEHADLNSAEQIVVDDHTLSFDTAAPHAKNAADVSGLDEQAMLEVSDWLVSQSNKTFQKAIAHRLIGEARTFQAVAMLALDIALFPKKDWNAALRARGIDPGNVVSKHIAAKAVAATFGFNPRAENTQEREKARNDIDRLSLPVEWLMNRILAMTTDQREKITLDEAGIETLVELIKAFGGIDAAGRAQRDSNKTPAVEREFKIDIDAQKGRKLLVSAGKQAIRAEAEVTDESEEMKIGAFIEIEGKKIFVSLEPKDIEALQDKVFAAAAPVDPTVDTLGELLQIGKLVEERETDLPANNLDDPDSASTKMRLTTRHFVLRPDKSVLISPILAEETGSPVVVAKPKNFVAGSSTGTLRELETRGRRKAEANIADPMRRRFFTSRIGDHEGTQGVARLVLTTAAAADDKRQTEDVGVLVQPLRSAAGNLPLDVSAAAFKAGFEFDLTATMLRAMVKDLPAKAKATAKAKSGKAKPATAAKLSIKGQAGTIELGAKTANFDSQTASKDGTVRLRGDHLLAIAHTLVELPLTSHISVAVDPTGGLRMTFSTKLADYEVYAPALMKDSDLPSNRYFKAIEAK